MTTPATNGRVGRLGNNPRVEMRRCTRMDSVKETTPVVVGSAEIESGVDETAKLNSIFLAKFRAEYTIFMFIERLGTGGRKDRVMLGITPA